MPATIQVGRRDGRVKGKTSKFPLRARSLQLLYLGGANVLGKIDGFCPYRKAFCGDKGEIADAAPTPHIVIEIEGLQGAGASSLLTTTVLGKTSGP